MKTTTLILSTAAAGTILLLGCDSPSSEGGAGSTSGTTSITSLADSADAGSTTGSNGLHPAFDEFDPEMVIYVDGDEVVLETDSRPNHTTPYWGEGHEMYEEPVEGWEERATPSRIPDRDGSFVLRVPADPQIAATASETPLGAIGVAVSGVAIFNEQEGMGILSDGVATGLDFSGGHIGPSQYHYHTEPKAFTDDDDSLVGVMSDGLFIYGRKCNSTGDYPLDLDTEGGHTHTTQHGTFPEYHYHIDNELFLGAYYLIFDGDFMGTPGTVQ